MRFAVVVLRCAIAWAAFVPCAAAREPAEPADLEVALEEARLLHDRARMRYETYDYTGVAVATHAGANGPFVADVDGNGATDWGVATFEGIEVQLATEPMMFGPPALLGIGPVMDTRLVVASASGTISVWVGAPWP